jgi:hypothetical protein
MRGHLRPSYDLIRELQVHPDLQLRIVSDQQTQPHTKRRRLNSLDQDVHGIEIEKRLKRHMGGNDEEKQI